MAQSLDNSVVSLLQSLCTAEQVQGVLRRHKGEKDVRVTAENKEDLIQRNLRTAVESGSIKLHEVFALIRAAEENGAQHILYYTPKASNIKRLLNSHNDVAKALFHTSDLGSFPRSDAPSDGFNWADFRQWNPGKRPRDWIAKVYGHETIQRFLREESHPADELLYRVYKQEDIRLVLLARWNTARSPKEPDLLEIRVPRTESLRRLESWKKKLWDLLAPAFSAKDFSPWDLTPIRRKMIEEHKHNSRRYTFRATRVIDPSHTVASFEPHAQDFPLFKDQIAADAISDLMSSAQSRCTHLSTVWLKQKDGVPDADLVTLVGGREVNELVVMPKCRAEDVDYVTEQLRTFGK